MFKSNKPKPIDTDRILLDAHTRRIDNPRTIIRISTSVNGHYQERVLLNEDADRIIESLAPAIVRVLRDYLSKYIAENYDED
jgi:hypothetical protein